MRKRTLRKKRILKEDMKYEEIENRTVSKSKSNGIDDGGANEPEKDETSDRHQGICIGIELRHFGPKMVAYLS
jgi:hypothetical protein